MTIMRLLALLSLWLYISTATTQSVGNDFNFMYAPLAEQGLTVTQAIAIRNLLQYGHPTPGQDNAQLDLQTCEENLQGLTARLDLMETENNNKDAEISRLEELLVDLQISNPDPVSTERNEGNNVLKALQEVQAMLQELQAKEANINHTLTTHEEVLNRYKDEVATLTGTIQDQQSVIQELRYFSNTLPDEIDELHQRINDHHNQTKMQYDELNNKIDNLCVSPYEKYKGACYNYNHTRATWVDARKDCLSKGGDLAVDNFNTLKEFVRLKHRNSYPWIGIRRNVWMNGQAPQQQQWQRNEPDEDDQCGYMWTDGLGDLPCHNTQHFICQLY